MLRIVTVCGCGQGSSLILRMWTDDVVKEMGIEARVENMEVTSAKGAKCDLVLTSKALVPVVEGQNHETRAILNFLDKKLIRKEIEAYCDEHGIDYKKEE